MEEPILDDVPAGQAAHGAPSIRNIPAAQDGTEGVAVGFTVSAAVGIFVGDTDSDTVGVFVGDTEGVTVGVFVGVFVGDTDVGEGLASEQIFEPRCEYGAFRGQARHVRLDGAPVVLENVPTGQSSQV